MAGEFDWTLTWTSLQDGSTITDTNFQTSTAVSNDITLGTEVAVEVAYGGTVDEGVKVYVCREDGDGTYEDPSANDTPWGFEMPSAVSGTARKSFTVPPSIPRFQIVLENNTGATVTVSVDYRQAVAAS